MTVLIFQIVFKIYETTLRQQQTTSIYKPDCCKEGCLFACMCAYFNNNTKKKKPQKLFAQV